MEAALLAAQADILRLSTELEQVRAEIQQRGITPPPPNQRRPEAIMDSKAFSRLPTFKGGSSGVWLKWFKKFEALIVRTHPHQHVQIWLDDVRHGMPKDMIHRDDYYSKMTEESDRSMFLRVDPDIFEALHFLLEDEAADILDNAEGGFQAVWRLEQRYNKMSRSRKLNDLHHILNPENAKNVGDILGAIERWKSVFSDYHLKSAPHMTCKLRS